MQSLFQQSNLTIYPNLNISRDCFTQRHSKFIHNHHYVHDTNHHHKNALNLSNDFDQNFNRNPGGGDSTMNIMVNHFGNDRQKRLKLCTGVLNHFLRGQYERIFNILSLTG